MTRLTYHISGWRYLVRDEDEPVYFEDAQIAFDYMAGRLSQAQQEYYREKYRLRELRRHTDGGLLTNHTITER